MSQRITNADLEAAVKRINIITGSPLTTYTTRGDGTFQSNIGNYHLDGAYGGWALRRISNTAGGVEDVLQCGFVSKRELYQLLHAFIRGLDASKAKP